MELTPEKWVQGYAVTGRPLVVKLSNFHAADGGYGWEWETLSKVTREIVSGSEHDSPIKPISYRRNEFDEDEDGELGVVTSTQNEFEGAEWQLDDPLVLGTFSKIKQTPSSFFAKMGEQMGLSGNVARGGDIESKKMSAKKGQSKRRGSGKEKKRKGQPTKSTKKRKPVKIKTIDDVIPMKDKPEVEWYLSFLLRAIGNVSLEKLMEQKFNAKRLSFIPTDLMFFGDFLWFFVGFTRTGSEPMRGKSRHKDTVLSTGSYHIQLRGTKVRSQKYCSFLPAPSRSSLPHAYLSFFRGQRIPLHYHLNLQRWKLWPLNHCKKICGRGPLVLDVPEGHFISLNTDKWYHNTALLQSNNQSGLFLSIAREYFEYTPTNPLPWF